MPHITDIPTPPLMTGLFEAGIVSDPTWAFFDYEHIKSTEPAAPLVRRGLRELYRANGAWTLAQIRDSTIQPGVAIALANDWSMELLSQQLASGSLSLPAFAAQLRDLFVERDVPVLQPVARMPRRHPSESLDTTVMWGVNPEIYKAAWNTLAQVLYVEGGLIFPHAPIPVIYDTIDAKALVLIMQFDAEHGINDTTTTMAILGGVLHAMRDAEVITYGGYRENWVRSHGAHQMQLETESTPLEVTVSAEDLGVHEIQLSDYVVAFPGVC